MQISIFSNSFQTVPNWGVMKKMKVAQEGSMYTHNIFRFSNAVWTGQKAHNVGLKAHQTSPEELELRANSACTF